MTGHKITIQEEHQKSFCKHEHYILAYTLMSG